MKFPLPETTGSLIHKANIGKMTFYGTDGIADALFIPHDMEDLVCFLRKKHKEVPITFLGAGSNILVRDGGVEGVVVKLAKRFDQIYVNDGIIEAGAACSLSDISKAAIDHSLKGLGFLSSIPGTAGGAFKMNAGCFSHEIGDIFVEAEAIDSQGQCHWLTKSNVQFSYRQTNIPDDWTITRIWLQGEPANSSEIWKEITTITDARKKSRHPQGKSCGSYFKNPEGHKAWKLIDEAGCRGMKIGEAIVSDIHCNFIINTGNATATDIESLGDKVIQIVHETCGITLIPEVKIIGRRLHG